LIEAERIAHSAQQGIHGRRRAGTGETFWQFRRYEQGDSVDRIDWRQSSRTDKIFIREREYEAAQNAYLWTDSSGSMQYTSQKSLPTKAQRAQLIMLALSSLLLRGGETDRCAPHDVFSHSLPKPAAGFTPRTSRTDYSRQRFPDATGCSTKKTA
jgi:uncharacterized protein (DUF58 family)